MNAYMCANMKAKNTNIQKSYVFADPMYIFSENGSEESYITFIPFHQCPSVSQENTYSQKISRQSKWKWVPMKFGLSEIWKGVLNKDTRLPKEKSCSCRSVEEFQNICWKTSASEFFQVKFKVCNFKLYQKETLTHLLAHLKYTHFSNQLLSRKFEKNFWINSKISFQMQVICKSFCDSYLPIITKIINESITEGTFPSELKLAEVTPVFKKLNCMNEENYRSISLLSHMSKAFERILYNQLNNFMKDKLSNVLVLRKVIVHNTHCQSWLKNGKEP